MSEGTATPNSLIHHHHLHPSLHHHISLQNPNHKESDNNNGESLLVDGVKMENHNNHHHHQQQQLPAQPPHQQGGKKIAPENNATVDGIKNSTSTSDGSYQCQFCDKSFPRLGYLKKHEQVGFQSLSNFFKRLFSVSGVRWLGVVDRVVWAIS